MGDEARGLVEDGRADTVVHAEPNGQSPLTGQELWQRRSEQDMSFPGLNIPGSLKHNRHTKQVAAESAAYSCETS